jgi:hypothetical protein
LFREGVHIEERRLVKKVPLSGSAHRREGMGGKHVPMGGMGGKVGKGVLAESAGTVQSVLEEVRGVLLCDVMSEVEMNEMRCLLGLSGEGVAPECATLPRTAFVWNPIFNDRGMQWLEERGRYQCELSENNVKRTGTEDRIHEMLQVVHARSSCLRMLGKPFDHAILLSTTERPTPARYPQALRVFPQKRHCDFERTNPFWGTSQIVVVAVMEGTALDVWVPSEGILRRVPIPVGQALVLPGNTVHRGIGLEVGGLDANGLVKWNGNQCAEWQALKKQPCPTRLHIRLHWYIVPHDADVADGSLNSKTDWELLGYNIRGELACIPCLRE